MYHSRILGIVAISASLLTLSVVHAGPLTPPPGAISATGPRQINQQYIGAFPFVISQPGAYVLVGNITATGAANGIEIDADNVTLDLNGFTMNGNGIGFAGIYVTSPGPGLFRKNITIRNGSLESWGSQAIDLSNASNVRVEDISAYFNSVGIQVAYQASIQNCVVENNFFRGIYGGNVVTVSDCTAVFNGGGIELGSVCSISRCCAEANFGPGFRVIETCTFADCVARNNSQPKGSAAGFEANDRCNFTGCVAVGNTSNGFYTLNQNTFTHCTAQNNSSAGFEGFDNTSVANCNASGNSFIGIYFNGGTITNCTANANGSIGIATFFDYATITNCTACKNGSVGIRLDAAGSVVQCTANQNFLFGIEASAMSDGSRIIACVADRNDGDGISAVANCRVDACSASNNTGDGIQVADRCTVVNSSAIDNGTIAGGGGPGAGIRCTGGGARIDSNHVSGNDTGIDASVPFRNTIIRNSAFGNGPNYNLNVANDIGPIGTAAASTSPWANISF